MAQNENEAQNNEQPATSHEISVEVTDESLKAKEEFSLQTEASKQELQSTTPVILTTPPQIENMEVHHHGHVHHQKKWKEYLYQFFMLFLAVFFGFLAENAREHYVEGLRAKEYAKALLADLVQDTTLLDNTKKQYERYIALTDTLLESMTIKKPEEIPGEDIIEYSLSALSANRVPFNGATINQLISSGNMRYIRSADIKAKIAAYDNMIRNFSLRQDLELVYAEQLQQYRNKIFDWKTWKVIADMQTPTGNASEIKLPKVIVNKDAAFWQDFLSFCAARKINWINRIRVNIIPILKFGGELIYMLKEEYNFKDS